MVGVRWLIVLVAITASSSVCAEPIKNYDIQGIDAESHGWVLLSKNNKALLYINPSRIKRDGNLSRIWSLVDYFESKTARGLTWRSSIFLDEFDCKAEKVRNLSETLYSGPAGLGDIVNTNDAQEAWEYFRPNSAQELVFKVACPQN